MRSGNRLAEWRLAPDRPAPEEATAGLRDRELQPAVPLGARPQHAATEDGDVHRTFQGGDPLPSGERVQVHEMLLVHPTEAQVGAVQRGPERIGDGGELEGRSRSRLASAPAVHLDLSRYGRRGGHQLEAQAEVSGD